MAQKVQILRSLVEQRLTAAAEEIFGLFERTIVEYEEELCRTKEENQRQRQILDCVWNPRVLIHKTDVQQHLVVKEEVPPEQQEWNPIVDQEEPEPEPPHFKEEQEELWTSQEVNITKFPSTPVPVKCEDDEFNQTQTEDNKMEANKVDCGGSEPASSFHPHRHLQTKTEEQIEDSEETEDSDEDQTLNHKPESKLPTNSSIEQMETETDGDDSGGSEPDMNPVHMESVKRRTFDSQSLLEEHMDTHTGQKLVGSSECEATFSQKKNMTQETNSPRDMMKNTVLSPSDGGCEKKPYHCSVCTKTFSQKSHLEIHMTSHTGEKRFKCSLCHKCFRHRSNLKRHMRAHTGEKLFHCPVCQKRFICNSHLTGHMIIHTGEKPFSCSECGKRFTWKIVLERHMRLHTGEKPFSCSECGKRFTRKMGLERHVMLHTGEKPFSCSECGKRFTRKTSLERHMMLHTGERPFSCGVCQKRFRCKQHVLIHMKIHTRG
ncbi:gastrula zinc finger protein XlCGF57.1-like isoform X2 [Sphaeramia orbicularis]|uniref:gastrula zinc finger protein XlCGF57.1-like isoform X2 n=1 Tax=Sphaeramia orbicularis TaxID=375764 RepID=UPI00118036DA|nr:gastrula zinc finger protein XlCGF57.1-like isoform X2 [Sphaeramia orbicularis]